jgi:hypothetical protein
MKARYTVSLAMLAGAAFGALAVNGLSAQGKPPAVYAIVAFNDIGDPAGFKTNLAIRPPTSSRSMVGTSLRAPTMSPHFVPPSQPSNAT